MTKKDGSSLFWRGLLSFTNSKEENREKNVMLMSHHDVVPAEGEWSYSPFSGQIAEGCI